MSNDAADMALVTTRGVAEAALPATYEAARNALAQCDSVDECSTWAKKASALASYARQSEDKTLEQMAVRIRARAIRRCGELLKEIPAHKGGRQPVGAHPPVSRAQAAKDAGLTKDQHVQAVRVANVPGTEFEDAVESERPPTIEALADRGTRKKPEPLVDIEGRDPEEYNRALLFNGAMRDLATTAKELEPALVVRGAVPRHYARMRDSAAVLVAWLNELLALLEATK